MEAVNQAVHDAILSICIKSDTPVVLLAVNEKPCNIYQKGSSKSQIHACYYSLGIVMSIELVTWEGVLRSFEPLIGFLSFKKVNDSEFNQESKLRRKYHLWCQDAPNFWTFVHF